MSASWPDDIEEKYFNDLLGEISGLLVLWYQWGALFEQSTDRLKEMGRAGNLLFGTIERVFYRDVVLGICRVTDPEKQGRDNSHHNISIRHFQAEPYGKDSRLQELIDDALKKSEPFRPWRDKRLSHIDVNTGIGWKLPQGCGHDAVSQSLEAICAVLRRISSAVAARDLLLGGDHTSLLQNEVRVPVKRTLRYLLQGYQHVASEK
jgi:hypothetical protein